MIVPEDDFPHPVPPQAFMVWKENWVFPAIDTERRVASLFHFSMRPAAGQGVFSAKLSIEGWEHRYVARSPIPRELTSLHPVSNDTVALEILEPGRCFRIRCETPELTADITYNARFPVFDFADGPRAPGESLLGEIGRSVFPYNHCEQALSHAGMVAVHAGPHAGRTLEISGYACRDHSWGWRNDLAFQSHHWVCASFEDRFVEGSVMTEDYYPLGPKAGGWISTEAGNDPVEAVEIAALTLDDNRSLPPLDGDLRYRMRTVGGQVATVIAHLGNDYGRLYLDARAPDRATIYQDVQIFCDYTLVETGQDGAGVIESGKRARGPGVADSPEFRRPASPR